MEDKKLRLDSMHLIAVCCGYCYYCIVARYLSYLLLIVFITALATALILHLDFITTYLDLITTSLRAGF